MYAPPAAPPQPPQTPSVEQARSQLLFPAIVLAVLSGLLILVFMFDLLLVGFGDPIRIPDGSGGTVELPRAFLIGTCIWAMLANVFNMVAAIQMARVRWWGMAIAGCIVAAIPLTTSACCLLTLPFSIWGIVVLLRPGVREAFRSQAQ